MRFWDAKALDLDDEINRQIWATSRAVMRRVLTKHSESPAGLLQADHDLPWVPDLAGQRWREPGAVFVIGSAYSPFIDPADIGRGRSGGAPRRSMKLLEYNPNADVGTFQRRFVRDVVADDSNYYNPLATLLEPSVDDASQVVLLDLCRACLIDRKTGKGGDDALVADPELFMALAEENWGWTRTRLDKSRAEVIVVLGLRAEHALLRLLDDDFEMRKEGARTEWSPPGRQITDYASSTTLGGWLDGETWWEATHRASGRRWKLLPVYHPARFSKYDPGYERSRRLLAAMTGRPVPDRVHAPEAEQGVQQSKRDRRAVDTASWAWVLAASVPPVGRLLATHPDAGARTGHLVETLDLERLVVLGDVMFNKCRMSYLAKAAPNSEAHRARLAWERLEAGMSKRHVKPSGWTGAAKLLRDGAEDAMAEIQGLEIGRLVGVALRVVNGPYREANKRGIK